MPFFWTNLGAGAGVYTFPRPFIGGEKGKISLMSQNDQSDLLNPGSRKEPRSYLPWAIAGVVVALIVTAALLIGHRPTPPANPGGAGLAAPAAYAKNLAISNLKMSEAAAGIGGKQTYIDGDIANRGAKTLTGITVQVAFLDFTGKIGQKNTMPMDFIRTRVPTVDTVPVSAAPIAPGQTREFRLIFDHVTDSWNQQYPEIRIIAVQAK